jgi:hypothetical protein
MRAIRTKFLPVTNHKGARVKATLVEDLTDGLKPMTKTRPYGYEASGDKSHRPSAVALLLDLKEKWGNAWSRSARVADEGIYIGKGEYIFTIEF